MARKLLVMLPTDRPRSLAASRRTSIATVGLGGFMLVSGSTRPGIFASLAIKVVVRRCSSTRSVPWIDSEMGLPPPTESTSPTWVTVMPASVLSLARSGTDISSTLRLRSFRSTSRMNTDT